jgi:hypothetical protein
MKIGGMFINVIDILNQSPDVCIFFKVQYFVILTGSCFSNRGTYSASHKIKKIVHSSLTVFSFGQSASVDIHATHNTP